jgi:predicted PilT family ATPase
LTQVVEFEIDSSAVRHVVGKAGSGITKFRDDLGVRVDFADNKKGSAAPVAGAKATVTIKGRKENAEEAKRRIISLVERIGDEVTLSIPLPASLDRGSLIGKQGTYLKRLEEKYEVRINFPRGNKEESAASTGPAEITIRGPSNGAKQAKGELVGLIEYEKEHGNVLSFSVPSKALGRILGRGGENVNRIKDDTGVASLDIDDDKAGEGEAGITLRGTKAALKKAREEIEKVVKEVGDEKRIEVSVPKEYHTSLIGSGGSASTSSFLYFPFFPRFGAGDGDGC